jgi:superfamily II DNA or RNA helicase
LQVVGLQFLTYNQPTTNLQPYNLKINIMKLRQYQQDAINQLRASFAKGNKHVILCAPTGAGKTVIFSTMVALAAKRGNKVLIVTDRIELLTQSGGALNYHNIKPVEITAKSAKLDESGQIYTAMVETLHRRLKKANYANWFKTFDLIIFDEAHKQAFNKLFPYISDNTFVIGATATPHREGNQQSLDEFYTDIIEPVTISKLIELGYLAKPRYFGIEVDLKGVKTTAGDYNLAAQAQLYQKKKIYIGVVENYKRICNSLKTLVFCSTIESSKEIKNEFLNWGLNAKHLDSEMSSTERENILNWYHNTKNAILCNVGILTTGFDAPSTEVVILYRATKSLPLYLQMVGRGARIAEGKKEFYILDFGNNVERFKYWHIDRPWELKKKEKRKGDGLAALKNCPKCKAFIYASARLCAECGHEFKKSKKEIEEAKLVELKDELKDLPKWQILKEAENAPIDKLVRMTKAKLIKPFWVLHKCFNSYHAALEYTRGLGYKDGFLFMQKKQGNFKHLK